MKREQLTKWADELAEEYRLSYQLTAGWLRDQGFPKRVELRPEEARALQFFATLR